MDLRKAALFATRSFFWFASLFWLLNPNNWEDLLLYTDSGSKVLWIFGMVLNTLGLVLDPIICYFWLDSTKFHMIFALAIQAGFVCFYAIFWTIAICAVGSMKTWIWLMIVSNSIKFIPHFLFLYDVQVQRPTQVPQLSQPRPNLLANEPPTALTPNFEDVEQPPPSYEEYLAQGNDFPPKYEDLEEAPPAYQETIF